MTTTPTVRRTQVRTGTSGFTLDPRTSPTDQVLTASGSGSTNVTLATPASPSAPTSDDFDGSWFRITNAGGGPANVKVDGTTLVSVPSKTWADVIWTQGSPSGQWRVSATGPLP